MDSIFDKDSPGDARLLKISSEIDEFEGYAHPHGARMARIADALAAQFNFASQDRLALTQAALVHDFGEMVMNRDYIKTDRVLTDDERADLHRHPVIGEQEAAKSGLSRAVQLLVRWHHEWWNGTGYPDALEHEQIPLAARILRVADTFAALTDARPYSVPISDQEAKRYLIEWSGIEFDPRVVKAFLQLAVDSYRLTDKSKTNYAEIDADEINDSVTGETE